MSHQVAVRKNETGEVRMCAFPWDWNSDHDLYYWTDGNNSCDCNRGDNWDRAGGKMPGPNDNRCGDGAFTALYALLSDGSKVTIEEETKSDSTEGR